MDLPPIPRAPFRVAQGLGVVVPRIGGVGAVVQIQPAGGSRGSIEEMEAR